MADDDKGRGGDKGKGGGRREDSVAELIIADALRVFTNTTGRDIGTYLPADWKAQARSLGLGSTLRGIALVGKYVVPGDEEARGAFEGFFKGLADGLDKYPENELKNRYGDLIKGNPDIAKLEAYGKEGRFQESRTTAPYAEAFAQLSSPHQALMEALVRRFNDKGAYLKARITVQGLNGLAAMAELAQKTGNFDAFADQAKSLLAPPPSPVQAAASDIQKAIKALKDMFGVGAPGQLTFAQQTREIRAKQRGQVTPFGIITGESRATRRNKKTP